MRELKNMTEFEADYKSFYNGDLESLNFDVVIDEVYSSKGNYELAKHESNVNHGKTFFFDEELICIDEENEEYDVIATYTGHGNH